MPEFLIPFPGLYESWLSGELDRAEEMEAENMAEDEADNWPAALRLSASDIGGKLWEHVDYSAAHGYLARAYLDAFDDLAGEALGETRTLWRNAYDRETRTSRKERYQADTCGFQFADMSSPREYNFTTDRLFATASRAFARRLWKRSKADNHETLRHVIRERFTSRDGFISHYSNDLDAWPRDLRDWDHNELGTLLAACLALTDFDDDDLMMRTIEGDTGHNALNEGLRWDDLQAALMDLRIEKLVEWYESDPDAVARWKAANPNAWDALRAHDGDEVATLDLPMGDACGAFYRCHATADLFA